MTFVSLFTAASMKAEVSSTTAEPSITTSVDNEYILYYSFLQGDQETRVINVKAENLTEDIKVTYDAYGSDTYGNSITPGKDKFDVSTTTIPAAEAMSENGYDLTFTINALKKEETFMAEVLLSSSGAKNDAITFYWAVLNPVIVNNLAELRSKENDLDSFLLEGEVGVSYSDGNEAYIQDATGGIRMAQYGLEGGYTRGDHYTHILSSVYHDGDNYYLYLSPNRQEYTTQKEVHPTSVTIAELKANTDRYESCLVHINDVQFGTAANGTFATTANTVTQNGNDIQVDVFEGSNLIGATIPQNVDIVGIVRNTNPLTITLRDANDLLPATAIDAPEINNRVWVANNTVWVKAESAVDVAVFNLLGKQVAAQTAVENTEFALPAGVYVVKAGDKAVKVVIK